MIFYHVSTNLKHNGRFEPRIPSCRHKEKEDEVTPRVSVGLTIEDCLTAIPNGGFNLDHMNIERRGYYLIFKIDTEKLGISDDHIVTSQTLFEKDLVRDAEATSEHWITCPFTVPAEDKFMIRLTVWEEGSADLIPHAIYCIAEEKYDGDYFRAYFEEKESENIPCATLIQDADYIHEEVEAGNEVTLYFDTDVEKEAILQYVEEHLNADVTDVCMDEVSFTMRASANLRRLFMLHADVAMLHI